MGAKEQSKNKKPQEQTKDRQKDYSNKKLDGPNRPST